MQPYERFESEFAEWSEAKNPVACSSGTSALQLALEAFKLPPRSHVIVPEFTMIACARAVTMAGLTPVFVDCDENLLIDVDQIEDTITNETVAIMPVHIYGRRCDMETIGKLANKYGLYVVEDCAEFHGAPLSGVADAYCWSFYRNKIVAGEEGGLVSFKCGSHAKIARLTRSHGFTERHDFLHWPRGINARLSNAHAMLMLESLDNVEENLIRRTRIEQWYNEFIPQSYQMPRREVCWVYDIRTPGIDVGHLVSVLNEHGIAARHSFKPMSMQPEYRGHYKHLQAYQLSREVWYLPVDPIMTQEDVEWIASFLKS